MREGADPLVVVHEAGVHVDGWVPVVVPLALVVRVRVRVRLRVMMLVMVVVVVLEGMSLRVETGHVRGVVGGGDGGRVGLLG